MTPTGIEPVTFRFVVQHLNHCATAVPPIEKVLGFNFHQGTRNFMICQVYTMKNLRMTEMNFMNLMLGKFAEIFSNSLDGYFT